MGLVPRIIATFGYRYEPDWLVEQLRESLWWVDGFAEIDDRDRIEPWGNAKERTAHLTQMAVDMGADWVFHTAPDERLEKDAGKTLRRLVETGRHDKYRFHLREMWTPDAWRSDGIWGRKRRTRLYRIGGEGKSRNIDLNIYHLKMIEPENRVERARVHTLHNTWDNKTRGFDYMLDEKGIELTRIPEGREYLPEYRPYEFKVGV